jgi:hypothetical protein
VQRGRRNNPCSAGLIHGPAHPCVATNPARLAAVASSSPGFPWDSGKPNSNGALECPLASMRSLGVIRGPGGHHSKPASRLPASSRAAATRQIIGGELKRRRKTSKQAETKTNASEPGLCPEATGLSWRQPEAHARQPVVTKAKINLSSCKVNAKFPHFQLNDRRAGGSHCQLMTNGFRKKQLRA